MRKISIFGFFLMMISLLRIPAYAKGEIQVGFVEVTHFFGDHIQVRTTIKPADQIKEATIIFFTENGTHSISDSVLITANGGVDYRLDLQHTPIRPFSHIEIIFEIYFDDGTKYESDSTGYFYDDNRFDWQSIHNHEFSVFWYQKDPDLGREILKTAYEGFDLIQNQLDVPSPDGIHIYAYANAGELQDTLISTDDSTSWVAGHADPDIGVIVVSLPPGPNQLRELQRQIPHELSHVLLYKKIGDKYSNLPRWLNEGLASQFELFPNPDFELLLDKAIERQALIPLTEICHSFPIDAANFQLSYAESLSFVLFLENKFGNKIIDELIQVYADDFSCDQGVKQVFNSSLDELEADWRQFRFNENSDGRGFKETGPLIIILAFSFIVPVVMIAIGIVRFSKRESKTVINYYDQIGS